MRGAKLVKHGENFTFSSLPVNTIQFSPIYIKQHISVTYPTHRHTRYYFIKKKFPCPPENRDSWLPIQNQLSLLSHVSGTHFACFYIIHCQLLMFLFTRRNWASRPVSEVAFLTSCMAAKLVPRLPCRRDGAAVISVLHVSTLLQ
jgi:hypothetical protein